jgi:ABC-type molybdate transport system substrate-binding protein
MASLAILVGLATLVACGDDANDIEDIRRAEEAAATTAPTASDLEGSIKVMVTDPLTEAFDEIGAAFEQVHPRVTVDLDHGTSSSLRDLILAEVPADVFATADSADMDALAGESALAGDPAGFATDDDGTYAIAPLSGSTHTDVAEAFVDFVLSGRSEGILSSHGFDPPS